MSDGESGRLAAIYSEVFSTVFAFRAARDEERPAYGTFRAHVMSLLNTARREVDRENLDPRGFAQLAVVALVDETVQTSDWMGAGQWQDEPLQLHYYGDYLAGEKFFDRLDQLRTGTDDDLLEVYFLCLCAGLRGVYHDAPAELESHRRKLFHQMKRLDLREEKHLTEDAYGRHLERTLTRSRFPIWWVAPFAFGAVGLYVAYYVILSQQVGNIVQLAS